MVSMFMKLETLGMNVLLQEVTSILKWYDNISFPFVQWPTIDFFFHCIPR